MLMSGQYARDNPHGLLATYRSGVYFWRRSASYRSEHFLLREGRLNKKMEETIHGVGPSYFKVLIELTEHLILFDYLIFMLGLSVVFWRGVAGIVRRLTMLRDTLGFPRAEFKLLCAVKSTFRTIDEILRSMTGWYLLCWMLVVRQMVR